MSTPTTRGRFLWHELITRDPKAAIAFYSKVVGWKTQAWETMPGYTMWVGKRGPVGGVMTLPAEASGAPPHWLGYIGTTDVEATMRDAVRLGGRVVKPIETVPTVGRMVLLADPQGAVFSAFQPERPMPDDGTTQLGDFTWHELATTNAEAAFRFYQTLFGWQKTSAMNMGAMGIYQMFGWDGTSIGGIYRMTAEMPGPPHWLPYAFVRDAAAAAKLAVKEGAKLINGPMEVPSGGEWIAMAFDPQGAEFAVHSRAPAKAVRKAKPAKKKAAKKTAGKKAAPRKKATARKKTTARKKR